ncbi:hypothetical protein J116_027935 [Streptomyces thermolilacinus SPC6]|uniref:Uncharacterized protein n=1 Tax=Streptomyces thermolilacinus SPC6 TaxID=1306406 RepID=A0A1D3DZF9_9ACTN|nr:hypothetical protein J116_027935 [Streptomyces thermolilacinus SPC6]
MKCAGGETGQQTGPHRVQSMRGGGEQRLGEAAERVQGVPLPARVSSGSRACGSPSYAVSRATFVVRVMPVDLVAQRSQQHHLLRGSAQPVSSPNSRAAVASNASPGSAFPAGSSHTFRDGFQPSSTRPRGSLTTTVTPAMAAAFGRHFS